jgi:hypothetical protein
MTARISATASAPMWLDICAATRGGSREPFRSAVAEDLGRARNKLDQIQNRLDDVQGRGPTNSELRQLVGHQERYDSLYAALEMGGSPPPLKGEGPVSYRCRLLEGLQPFDDKHLQVNVHKLARLDDHAFSFMEREIMDAAQRVADNRSQGSFTTRGALREVRVKDPVSKREVIEYRGSPLTWMSQFMLPGQAVTAILDGNGRVLRGVK